MSLDGQDTSAVDAAPLLAAVEVEDLFGQFSYSIEFPTAERRLLLLHGDNGSGKTTVLRLLWNLLSPADNKGHRTYLSKTPFRRFLVHFVDGTVIAVSKVRGLLGSYSITITQNDSEIHHSDWPYTDDFNLPAAGHGESWLHRIREQIRSGDRIIDAPSEWIDARNIAAGAEESQAQYVSFLDHWQLRPLFLADDRSLYSDDASLARIRERVYLRDDSKRGMSAPPLRTAEIVDLELKITISRLNELLRTLTLGGQDTGSAGAHSIYRDVLTQLASPSRPIGTDSPPPPSSKSVDDILRELGESSPRFEEFGLTPHFAADDFMGLLATVPKDRRQLATEILVPYLESLKTRINALENAEQLLRALTGSIGSFLLNKRALFTPRDGLVIEAEDGSQLDPSTLSSGERQLLMLLATTILAGREGQLFIIDEPELSLGAGWQREILGTLLNLTAGTRLQFVVATHSIEMITSQPKSLVRLATRRNG